MRRVPLIAALAAALAAALPAAAETLLILTSEDVVARSGSLAPFVAAKRARGVDVVVATEADYGAAGLAGQERALAIRAWLAQAAPPVASEASTAHSQPLAIDPSASAKPVSQEVIRQTPPTQPLVRICCSMVMSVSSPCAIWATPRPIA